MPTQTLQSQQMGVMRQIQRGFNLLRRGMIHDAQALSAQLVDANPNSPQALAFAAEVCRASGDVNGTLDCMKKAVEVDRSPIYKLKLAWLMSEVRQRDLIPELAAQIAEQAAGDGDLLWQVGKLYYHHGFQREAICEFERARALIGAQPGLLYDLAIARFYSGDFEQAERDLNQMLEVAPQAGAALYLRAKLRRQNPDDNHVKDIESRLEVGFDNAFDEGAARYALAKELEDLDEHDRAFVALEAGASKVRSTLSYSISPVIDGFRDICTTFDATEMRASQGGWDETGAIFIVGMPRTGTTLVERLLTQSGKVRAAGELMDFGNLLTEAMQRVITEKPTLTPSQAALQVDFAAVGREYMRGARQMAGGYPLFIDKLPVNFMYCGMLRKALPNAKIIHLVRNPLDSCYAIFKTLFFGAYEFSYDLNELGDYYIEYRRMMDHWHGVLPGFVLDVHYEALVKDTESQARRIYDFCGLDWTANALSVPDSGTVFATASASQVREPVHQRSVASSARHAKQLAPLRAKLISAGILQS